MSEINYCKDCGKKWTKYCPIRVYGRVNTQTISDVDEDKDYCSKFMTKDTFDFISKDKIGNHEPYVDRKNKRIK